LPKIHVENTFEVLKLKNINFGLRQSVLLIPTYRLTKRNFEKLLLEATKSVLENVGVHFEGNRTVQYPQWIECPVSLHDLKEFQERAFSLSQTPQTRKKAFLRPRKKFCEDRGSPMQIAARQLQNRLAVVI